MSKLLEQIKRHEGFRKTPYKCSAGKWTIGYGCNLDSIGVDPEDLVWNESYAEHVLKQQVDEIYKRLNFNPTLDFEDGEDSMYIRECVIINMVFNMGLASVKKFKKMLLAIANDDSEAAANEMLMSKWATQVGSRATELAEQMRTGTWQF